MEIATLATLLGQRAKRTLNNPAQIQSEDLTQASSEALELVENKPIPQTMLLDLAIFRLMIALQMQPTELETNLANQALKKAQNLKLDDSGVVVASLVKYGDKESIWDMNGTVSDEDWRVDNDI